MSILLSFAVLLTVAATTLVVRSLTLRRARTARGLGRVAGYGFGAAGGTVTVPDTDARPGIAERIGRFAPTVVRGDDESLQALLVGAGMYTITPARFYGYRVLALALAAAVWLWSWSALELSALVGIGLGVVLLGSAWVMPTAEVKRRRTERLQRIDRSLPDLVDFLVVTVEAGIGFPAALQAAANRFPAPLGDELRLAVQGQRMGLSVEEALRDLLRRVDTPSMASFVRSLVQGETLGVSIGQILRSLATEMRKRRRQLAEEQAQKAPIKMLFPLATLIFPALFIVVLGPAVWELVSTLGGH